MSFFDSFGKPINDNNDDDKISPATESVNTEIRHDGFNYNYLRYSAEPNTTKSNTPAPKPLPDKLKEKNNQ